MMKQAPYPSDTRAKGWRFELDLERIEQSDTWALATPDVRPWLFLLWAKSWQQVPCGSLPNDDALIAARIGMAPKAFGKAKAVLLRGWWLADDGRLYHDAISERVLSMLDTRGADRTRQDARRNMFETIRERDGRACVYCGHSKYLTLDHLMPVSRGGGNDELNLAIACRPCNSKKRDRTPDEAEMPFVNQAAADRWRKYKESAGEKRTQTEVAGAPQRNDTGTGTGTGTGTRRREEEKETGAAKSPRPSRKCPESFEPADPEAFVAKESLNVDWRAETKKFRDHTFDKSKSDWQATWRNWIRRAAEMRPKGLTVATLSFRERDSAAAKSAGDRWMGSCAIQPIDDNTIEMEAGNARLSLG